MIFGLLIFHAAVVWAISLALAATLSWWRIPRADMRAAMITLGVWILPMAVVAAAGARNQWPPPVWPMLLVVGASGLIAYYGRGAAAWFRHASQASRLIAVFVALLLPALLMYPSILFFADAAKQRLIEAQYTIQAVNHPQELGVRLAESLKQIDATPSLTDIVATLSVPEGGTPQTDTAFMLWQRTDLAEFRLTSAIEVYGRGGALVSRFALNFPEYAQTAQQSVVAACGWETFGEILPFGSEERRALHSERAVCSGSGEKVGAIVVHVMLDYSTLPFISSQSPYFEFVRTQQALPREGTPGGDIELVIYGWGRLPIYTSGPIAWPIDDALFDRISASRQPFWARVRRGDRAFRVYVTNDRAGIYALGYPALGWFDHFVHLAELTLLVGGAYLILLAGAVAFGRLARVDGGAGRMLLREIRQSFYRKLFLAFVAASVIPVLILAFGIRAYFANLLRADVESEAARTAAVAQRVIQESAALQQRGTEALSTISDDVMVWISQVIDQDVNIFEGPRLIATSERDLFASGLLPTRTPDDVYRAIVLQHLPGFVGEDAIGTFRYMLAAAPVRLADRDAHPHRAAGVAAAGNRTRDRRARPGRVCSRRCCSSCWARVSGSPWRSGLPIR